MGREDSILSRLRPLYGEPEFAWLWLGTWSMGGVGFGPHNEAEAVRVLQMALAEGFTHFDTAPVYGRGISETLLGKVLKHYRQRVFICTKGGLRFEGKRVVHDAKGDSLRVQLQQSLQRLRTDYLDLYMLHWPDPEVSLSESIQALMEFKQEGLIRHWGVGNLSGEQILRYLQGQKAVPHQVHFSALCKDYNLLEVSARYCINCVVSVLEQGLLSDSAVSQGIRVLSRRDIRRKNPHFSDPEVLTKVDHLRRYCKQKGLPTSVAVLLWTGVQKYVHAMVVGPRKEVHIKELRHLLRLCREAVPSGQDSLFLPQKVRQILGDEIWEIIDSISSGRIVSGRKGLQADNGPKATG